MKKLLLLIGFLVATSVMVAQDILLNDLEYFERQGVNVLVFSNSFNGGFNDEKNSGIEIIHHGVRTVQGGAVRLNNTPEQWDLVPKMTNRKVDKENGSIEVAMRYDDYDFDSRVIVTAKGKAVEIAVYLDKPVPEKLAGEAGFNIEFLPSQYWLKTFLMDGVPDILQFIEHGVLNLVAQAEQIGHMASTLSNSVLDNYHHLGDAASITDGLHYDPSLKPYEVSADGKRSGTPDDMWAFTTRNPNLDLQAAGIFTSAARVLRGYNDELADRAQTQADRLRKEAEQMLSSRNSRFPRDAQAEADDDWLTGTGDGTTQTAQSTQISRRSRFHRDNRRPRSLWENLDRDVARNLQTALDSIPMKDDAYKQKLRPYVQKYNDYIKSFDTQNPYGVPIGLGNWAGVNAVLNFGITVNYAHIYFPDIVSKDEVYRVANWLYGCHPYHNYSFVAVVGATRPKQVFYGNNRADFSAIPGNVAPGLLFRKPDHFENYDDWPFLWGQNEGTIAGNTQYIIFGSALKNIVNLNLTK